MCIRGVLGPVPSQIWATRQVITSVQRQGKGRGALGFLQVGSAHVNESNKPMYKRKINLQTTFSEYISTKLRMHVITQIPDVRVWSGQRNSAQALWPEQREKLEREDQTGPTAGRRAASVDLSPVPTFMAAIGCHPAVGLHLIGWELWAELWLEEGCRKDWPAKVAGSHKWPVVMGGGREASKWEEV